MNKTSHIYYFSGTGNSLSIAKDLQSSLGDVCLHSIPTMMRSDERILIEGSPVGLVFPVYFGRPPVIVEEFLERVDFGVTDYIFAIANGGGAFGRTHRVLDRTLRMKGASLALGITIRMPGVHPLVHRFIRKTDEEFFREKRARMADIIRQIRSGAHGIETNLGVFGALFTHVVVRSLYKKSRRHSLDSVFLVNESCTRCGTCQRVCPVANIELQADGPKWSGECANCGRCYHMCPSEAIEFGDETMKRYVNPEIEIEELLA